MIRTTVRPSVWPRTRSKRACSARASRAAGLTGVLTFLRRLRDYGGPALLPE
ncbi:hypothetical protein [Nonomuraea sp. NPDC003709]|uniref:hypothetical protein n=1 Tax=Nonomuraea sp. NPDC003709 TaxID=3154450 RepID=UPI0033A13562